MSEPEDPIEAIARQFRETRERYKSEILDSNEFQDALRYLDSITFDFLTALNYVRLQGTRFSGQEQYLILKFASMFAESVLSVQMNAREGIQNPARRELRFVLEAAVKLSARDLPSSSGGIDDRLATLGDRSVRFEDYVADLWYFDDFEKPEEANADILSLYSDLSIRSHVTPPLLDGATQSSEKGEPPGMESVSTLNRFNKLVFRVYDIALVRIFHALGLSLAGDIFTSILDDEEKWRFHKGKHTARMSRCFDYKHERRVRRGDFD